MGFFQTTVETRELHKKENLRTHYYRNSFKQILKAFKEIVEQDNMEIYDVNEQYGDVFKEVTKLILDVYNDFGFKEYRFRLSLRDPNDTEKYFGNDELWEKSENELRQVLKELGVDYYEAIGEAAFYGPKLDVQVRSAIGHDVTLSTIQLDYQLPERFELTYIDENGDKARPVVVHRAILGSLDRFVAFLIEETKGVFPVWLAPVIR